MAVKVELNLDVTKALASADVLERRIRKISSTLADIFAKSGQGAREQILRQLSGVIDLTASTGGHVLQGESHQRFIAQQIRKMSSLPVYEPWMANLQRAGRILQPQLPGGFEYLSKFKPPPIPQTTLDPKLLAQGAKQLMGMGPLPQGPDWKTGAVGGLASIFSPWVGARLLNQAFGPVLGGMGGGGGGGFLKTIFGSGGASGFGQWYVLIQALRSARVALEEFAKAVKEGSQLYLRSAQLGTPTANLARLQRTFQTLGLPQGSIERLMAQGQFSRGLKFTGSKEFEGMVLGAGAGILSKEEMQGILNMSKDIAEVWKRIGVDANVAASNARNLFEVNISIEELKSSWGAFMSELAGEMHDVIIAVAQLTTALIRFGTFAAAVSKIIMDVTSGNTAIVQDVKHLKDMITGGDTGKDFSRFPLANVGARPESAWEKMGLVIHGGIAGSDYARQTAENTKKIADVLTGKFQPKDFVQKPIPYGEGMTFSMP